MNEIGCEKMFSGRNMNVELSGDNDGKFKCIITLNLDEEDRKEICKWIASGFEEELCIRNYRVDYDLMRYLRNDLLNDIRYAEKCANEQGVRIDWSSKEYKKAMLSEEYKENCGYWEDHDVPHVSDTVTDAMEE